MQHANTSEHLANAVGNRPTVDRREFIAGAASATLIAAVRSVFAERAVAVTQTKSFTENFRWEVATAAHQIEGNNTNSDFWFLENIRPTTFTQRSGDACDSYHRYEEDVALISKLGFSTYRLSIEWSRIEPSPGEFSIAESDYYKRVLECCHKYHVDPAVTFLHGTASRWFAELGGWLKGFVTSDWGAGGHRQPESSYVYCVVCSAIRRSGCDCDPLETSKRPSTSMCWSYLF